MRITVTATTVVATAAHTATAITVVIAAMIVTASPVATTAMADTTVTIMDTMEGTTVDMASEAKEGGRMMPMAGEAAAPTGTASTCTVKLGSAISNDVGLLTYLH